MDVFVKVDKFLVGKFLVKMLPEEVAAEGSVRIALDHVASVAVITVSLSHSCSRAYYRLNLGKIGSYPLMTHPQTRSKPWRTNFTAHHITFSYSTLSRLPSPLSSNILKASSNCLEGAARESVRYSR